MTSAADMRSALAWLITYGAGKGSYERLRANPDLLESAFDALQKARQEAVLSEAEQLVTNGVGVVSVLGDQYPQLLHSTKAPPPLLFVLGNEELMQQPAVGICGARDAGERSLAAAATCSSRLVEAGFSVVSGYARGVDIAAHSAALDAGGSTVIVLPEGIARFRWKRDLGDTTIEAGRVLVVSQFPPRQPWTPGAAMARNGVIVGLSKAVVIVEAGAKGGTLAAGRLGLELKRRVVTLAYGDDVPPGNGILLAEGATAVRSPGELLGHLESPHALPAPPSSQLSLDVS